MHNFPRARRFNGERADAGAERMMAKRPTMGRRMWAVAIAAGLVILVATTGAASARRNGPLIGIGDQHPLMFTSKPWKRLDLRAARYIAPWDVLRDGRQLALLDSWVAAARRAHVRMLIGFGHSLRSRKLAGRLPTQRQFATEFKALRRRYPSVEGWLAWNEANNPGALTAHRAGRAAQYFDAVASNCRGCKIVAADLLDTSNMIPWLKSFRRHAHAKPRIWGLHNYGDTNGFKEKNTEALLAHTRGQIWFTEAGGVVLRRVYKGRKVIARYRYGTRHAAQATAQIFRLACLSSRITRVYVYNWQAPRHVTSWDSGLFDGRGRMRPAYSVLRHWIARAAHTKRRKLCGVASLAAIGAPK
jgi:hypothetical protein